MRDEVKRNLIAALGSAHMIEPLNEQDENQLHTMQSLIKNLVQTWDKYESDDLTPEYSHGLVVGNYYAISNDRYTGDTSWSDCILEVVKVNKKKALVKIYTTKCIHTASALIDINDRNWYLVDETWFNTKND